MLHPLQANGLEAYSISVVAANPVDFSGLKGTLRSLFGVITTGAAVEISTIMLFKCSTYGAVQRKMRKLLFACQ